MEPAAVWMKRLEDLGALLAQREQSFSVVIVGGVALARVGVRVELPTQDVDVIVRKVESAIVPGAPLPPELVEAASVIAGVHDLATDWFNAQSSGKFAQGIPLPEGIATRAEAVDMGGLTVMFAAHRDLVALKLHAAVDRFSPREIGEKHRDDLRMLKPSRDELSWAIAWLETALPNSPDAAALAREIVEDDGLGD